MIEYLTLELIIELHDELIMAFGGLAGIRDINLLCSAIETPKSSMFGHEFYPTVYDKASAYLFHIIQNHPFNDGNKRTAVATSYLFLECNNIPILFDDNDDALELLAVDIAQGKKTKDDISYFFEYGKEREPAFSGR